MIKIEYNPDLTKILRDGMFPRKKMGFAIKEDVRHNMLNFSRAISTSPTSIGYWEDKISLPNVDTIARLYEFALRRRITELPMWLVDGEVWNYTVNSSHDEPIVFNPKCIDEIVLFSGKTKQDLISSCNDGKNYRGSLYTATLIGKIYRVGLDAGYKGELWIPKS